ncbi:dTMP kinase [Candidatus Saccharibacteria bacterium]|nr:dTMP kinase [Candidatus Saccharibacteria bacterium]MBR6122856.1 dTMP kinase [Candidatus Saccharibacteria bacterium]
MYIVIEGQDGTGKSTQAELFAEHFRAAGRPVLTLHEPDGDLPQAHDLHDLILVKGKDYHLAPLTNVVLFTAARLELWHKLAEPVLKQGGVVISARNWWSTLAYQGYGEGVSRSKIIRLTKEMLPKNYVEPDKSVILTLPDKIREEREQARGKALETFEVKGSDFQQKVNHAYETIARDLHIPILEATGSIEEVHENLKKLFQI